MHMALRIAYLLAHFQIMRTNMFLASAIGSRPSFMLSISSFLQESFLLLLLRYKVQLISVNPLAQFFWSISFPFFIQDNPHQTMFHKWFQTFIIFFLLCLLTLKCMISPTIIVLFKLIVRSKTLAGSRLWEIIFQPPTANYYFSHVLFREAHVCDRINYRYRLIRFAQS